MQETRNINMFHASKSQIFSKSQISKCIHNYKYPIIQNNISIRNIPPSKIVPSIQESVFKNKENILLSFEEKQYYLFIEPLEENINIEVRPVESSNFYYYYKTEAENFKEEVPFLYNSKDTKDLICHLKKETKELFLSKEKKNYYINFVFTEKNNKKISKFMLSKKEEVKFTSKYEAKKNNLPSYPRLNDDLIDKLLMKIDSVEKENKSMKSILEKKVMDYHKKANAELFTKMKNDFNERIEKLEKDVEDLKRKNDFLVNENKLIKENFEERFKEEKRKIIDDVDEKLFRIDENKIYNDFETKLKENLHSLNESITNKLTENFTKNLELTNNILSNKILDTNNSLKSVKYKLITATHKWRNMITIKIYIKEQNTKPICFLGNEDGELECAYLNENNCEIFIDLEPVKFTFKHCFNTTGEHTIFVFLKEPLESCKYLFCNCSHITSIDLTNFVSSELKDCCGMFYNCEQLNDINFTNFNTSSVRDFYFMFNNCFSLPVLDLSMFKTDSATTMRSMFQGCQSLTSLNVSSFNTENVSDLSYMFNKCRHLTSLNVSNFTTKNAQLMNQMFCDCCKLANLDVANFDTQNVTNFYKMFINCKDLTSLNVSNFITKKATKFSCMFSGCANLKHINVENFDVANATDLSFMFNGCANLLELKCLRWNMQNAENLEGLFKGCEKLCSVEFSGNINETGRIDGMFDGVCEEGKLVCYNYPNVTKIVNLKTKDKPNNWQIEIKNIPNYLE